MKLLTCVRNIINEERIGKIYGEIKIKFSVENSVHGKVQRFRHGKEEEITNDELLSLLNRATPQIIEKIKEQEIGQDSSVVISQTDYPFLNIVTSMEEEDCYNYTINIVTTIRKKKFYPTGDGDIQIYV